MNVGFVGLGKLGMGVALAVESKGHRVLGVDPSPGVARILRTRQYPHMEADVPELLLRSKLRLVDMATLVHECELIFVCVQTPHRPEFEGVTPLTDERADFDYTALREAVQQIASHVDGLESYIPTVAIVSTCLPGTFYREIRPLTLLAQEKDGTGTRTYRDVHLPVVYNPSFIAMGSTVADFLDPEFVLIGCDDRYGDGNRRTWEFYRDTLGNAVEIVETDIVTAELTKVAYNAVIGQKIALANALTELAWKVGADADAVTNALALATRRIVSPAYTRGGMGDGGACLPPGELVMTETGMRPIEQVSIGERVLTLDGTLQRVLGTHRREYEGDLVRVSVRGLPGVAMTPDHPAMARRDLRGRYANGRKRTDVFPRSEVEQVEAAALGSDHLLTWPDHLGEPQELPEHATAEYLELAGWWLSEGSAELNERRGRLRFDLHVDEASEGERIAELLAICAPPRDSGRGANARITIHIEDNRRSVRLGSMALARQLVGDFGKGAAGKSLPPWALWGDEKTASLLLEGMLKGDGHIGHNGVSFSTISEQLAWGAFVLMTRLGVHPNLRVIPARPGHRRSFEVRVRNRAQARALFRQTNIAARPVGTHEVGTDDWRPVRLVLRERYEGPVHNLWVDGSNTFVTAAGAVHNCHPRDNIALSWLARRVGLSSDPFEAMMQAREGHVTWLAAEAAQLAMDRSLRVAVLGKAYKPGTNLTYGSAARLLAGHFPCDVNYDPLVDVDEEPPLDKPAVFVIATQHPHFACYDYPAGSVVIDPFRYIPDQEGVEVVRIGERPKP